METRHEMIDDDALADLLADYARPEPQKQHEYSRNELAALMGVTSEAARRRMIREVAAGRWCERRAVLANGSIGMVYYHAGTAE